MTAYSMGTSSAFFAVGTWTHAVLTMEGGTTTVTWTLYQDGSNARSDTGKALPRSATRQSNFIGKMNLYTGDPTLNGVVAFLRVWEVRRAPSSI